MAINVFEGARRIVKFIAVLAVVVAAVSLFNSNPHVTATFTVSSPSKRPMRSDSPCLAGDAVRESVEVVTKKGTKVHATLCFTTLEVKRYLVFDEPSQRGRDLSAELFGLPLVPPLPPLPPGYKVDDPPNAKPGMFDDLIPTKAIPCYIDSKTGMWWGYPPDRPEAQAYIKHVKESFILSGSDEDWIDAEWWRLRWKGILEGVFFLACGLVVFWVVTWVIGWIVRGFLGIPTGSDRKPLDI